MGISIWQLVIILVIVLLLFGTKRIKNIGGDIGSAIKNFRSAVHDGEKQQKAAGEEKKLTREGTDDVIEGEVTAKKNERA